MKTHIVQIGRSKRVEIPSALLRKTKLPEQAEVTALTDSILIKPQRQVTLPKKARAGWSAAFAEMNRNKDDQLLDDIPVSLSSWDKDEWQW